MGTQDSGSDAIDFVESYETYSFPVYWDESFETWLAFGVTGQPAAALLSPEGEMLGGWLGSVPFDEILDLATNA